MLSDPISDFLTRIRNASLVSKESVVIPHSKLKEKLTELLVNEGYLTAYKLVGDGVSKSIKIELKYTETGDSAIAGTQRISRPGKRVYLKNGSIHRSLGGLGTLVVSTSRGLLSDSEARKRKLGGESICEVWS